MGDLREFIAKRLDDMLDNGGRGAMWGSPEAYELQVLLLLELLYCRDDPHALMMHYSHFSGPRHPTKGCRVVSAVIFDHTVLARELRAFKEALQRDFASVVASSGHE